MSDYLKLFGLMVLVAAPCGAMAMGWGPLNRVIVAGLTVPQLVLGVVAFAILGVAIHRQRNRSLV